MDSKQDLSFSNNTSTSDIISMAATMAPATTKTSSSAAATNAISSSITSSTSSTSLSSSSFTCSTNCTTTSTSSTLAAAPPAPIAANDIDNNFHELCRSCGKTNEELYDLFQTTNCWNTTTTSSLAASTTSTTASPFNTSSTTCYTHLNTSTSNKQPPSSSLSATLSSSSSKATGATLATTLTPTTAFDSVAATAKATAKGQSNMENILQEMQIWHLQIKCNDGLPQRICAKCTAQFYMIHKFRRKCLKVQTQLWALYDEQKLQQTEAEAVEVDERQQQQQQREKDSNITIVPTSTPPPPTRPATSEAEVTTPPPPPKSLNTLNDLINDNHGPKQALSQTTTTKKSSSVNFETKNTWNTNDDATLLDNVTTMAKTEANNATPPTTLEASSAAYGEQKENVTLLTDQDEKPLPPSMVLNSEKSPGTLKNHKEQKCDNDADKEVNERCKLGKTSKSKSGGARLCVEDQEELLAAHIIFKASNTNDLKQAELIQSRDDGNKVEDCKQNIAKECTTSNMDVVMGNPAKCSIEENAIKLSYSNESAIEIQDDIVEDLENVNEISSKEDPTNLGTLFITKAALKAYTISQTKTPSLCDNSPCSTKSTASSTSFATSSSSLCQNKPDSSLVVRLNLKPTMFKAAAGVDQTLLHKTAGHGPQQVLATVNKGFNDDNNNDHNKEHQHNERNNFPSKIPSTTTTPPRSSRVSSCLGSKTKQNLVKTEVRLRNSFKRRSFAKRVRRLRAVEVKKRAERYKLNAKSLNLRRRRQALHTYPTTSSASSSPVAATSSSPASSSSPSSSSLTSSPCSSSKKLIKSQHELKCLRPDIGPCSSTSVKLQKELKIQLYRIKDNIPATKSTYEMETKTFNKIQMNTKTAKEKEEKLETPAIIMKDESSASTKTLSTSSASSASITSTSSSSLSPLSATTPAVLDLVKPLKEEHETNSYATNANLAIKRRRCSLISDTSRQGNEEEMAAGAEATAATTCYNTNSAISTAATTWKTKAAMKAMNANDMHMDGDMNVKQQQQQKDNDITKPILLPYSAAATSVSVASAATSLSPTTLCSIIDTSLKTLNENQSICHTMETNANSETVLSSKDHKVKDIKNTTATTTKDLQQQKHFNNLRPEEADQKQIKHNNDDDKDEDKEENQIQDDEDEEGNISKKSKKDKESENVITPTKSEAQEFINNNPLQEQQKPSTTATTESTSTTSTNSSTSSLTPPAKNACMKLIIQRKRGARFKCRRKDDILPKEQHQQETQRKKRKLCSQTQEETKLEMESLFSLDLNGDYSKEDKELIEESLRNIDDMTNDSDILEIKDQETENIDQKKTTEELNKENKKNSNSETEEQNKSETFKEHSDQQDPLANSETDSCLSYRDNNLYKNQLNEDEDDEEEEEDDLNDNIPLKFKLSKENLKLDYTERPKKLIIRVPLASLTQDFKRLHLTMEQEDLQNSTDIKEILTRNHSDIQLENKANNSEIEKLTASIPIIPNLELGVELNTLPLSGSSQSDLMGFSQTTVNSNSSQKSIEHLRSSDLNHYNAAASSKINDFINDFQNNCIDSSEVDDVLPPLPNSSSSKELSDEIRDVEDTLNGILSEMHDKDMYTPRSGIEEDFFPHSVYSPLTDSPTTPSQSFYAESPCTMNGNPLSVSPFIQHNMDYNAMTPQSNHSSMGPNSHMGSSCGGSSGNPYMFGENYPPYNESYAEETNQSELIAFQNDIPCFETLELTNPETPSEIIPTADLTNLEENNEADPSNLLKTQNNSALQGSLNKNDAKSNDSQVVDYVDLCQESNEKKQVVNETAPETPAAPEILTNLATYNPNTYQPCLQTNNPLVASAPNSQYIVTNTAQGPMLIANPNANSGQETIDAAFKANNNNLQFLTLGQSLEANKTQQAELQWTSSANSSPASGFAQQPVITSNPATTTYFINAGGEVYRASIPTLSPQNPPVNTLIVPPLPSPAVQQTQPLGFNKSSIDSNENYLQTLQQHQLPQHNTSNSQYIMVVNNLSNSPQYYATQPAGQTTNMGSSTVLFHQNSSQTLTNQCNFINAPTTPEISRPTPSNTPNSATASPKPQSDSSSASSQQSMHQRVNQQLQQQIKQRQLQQLRPRSPNHTQKINLVCRFCHKRPKFTNNVDYSNHIINLHPAEKPYNCPHCSMHFSRRFERQQHVAQVHGSRYQCAQCGLSFGAQRMLDFHLQKHHANLGRSNSQACSVIQQNSSFSTSSTSATATYQLLQQNQQQRLVRVEDVHVQVTGESKNKRSIDLQLDGTDINASQSNNEVENLSAAVTAQQQTRKLCCPDCNGDNDDCCASKRLHDHNNHEPMSQQQHQHYTGNESVNHHHVTIPSPEQTEPDSTTTLRHFRKRQLCEMSPFSSSSSSSCSYSISSNNNSYDIVVGIGGVGEAGSGGVGVGGCEQIVVERTLRGSHNCLFCEESFTNEIALRKHHHLAHGTQATMPFVCTVCKRGFRMRNALQRHMETHDAEGRPYECNICQVRFPRPSQLTLHKLTVHKFEKPHSCEECGKQFGTESAMKAHAKVHEAATTTTSQLPSCAFIDATTTEQQNLTTSGEIAATDSSLDLNNAADFNTSDNNIVSELTG